MRRGRSSEARCGSDRIMAYVEWLIPSLPLRVLTPSPAVLPDRIQRTLSHQPIVFRPTDTSCFHEIPGGLVRLSKVLLLSLHELHLPLARLKLPQVSSSKTRQREHGSCERSPSTTANFVSYRFH